MQTTPVIQAWWKKLPEVTFLQNDMLLLLAQFDPKRMSIWQRFIVGCCMYHGSPEMKCSVSGAKRSMFENNHLL